MKYKAFLSLDELTAYYVYANVPEYLYDNFRKTDSVFFLAKTFSTHDLVEEFNNIYQKEGEKTLDECVMLEAIIIALTFKPHSEVDSFFSSLDQLNIRWADKIKSLYHERLRIEYTFDLSSQINQATITQLSDWDYKDNDSFVLLGK
jgi:hypothetical protein